MILKNIFFQRFKKKTFKKLWTDKRFNLKSLHVLECKEWLHILKKIKNKKVMIKLNLQTVEYHLFEYINIDKQYIIWVSSHDNIEQAWDVVFDKEFDLNLYKSFDDDYRKFIIDLNDLKKFNITKEFVEINKNNSENKNNDDESINLFNHHLSDLSTLKTSSISHFTTMKHDYLHLLIKSLDSVYQHSSFNTDLILVKFNYFMKTESVIAVRYMIVKYECFCSKIFW